MSFNIPQHASSIMHTPYTPFSPYTQLAPYSASPVPSIEPNMEKIKTKQPATAQDKAFNGGFGPDAPSRDLPWPVNADVTAYELLAFLPHCLQSADVVYRFISNGGTRHTLWVILNIARDLPKEWHANRCGTTMYKAMADAGFQNWTVKVHDKWHDGRKPTWDETVLNVTGYRTPAQIWGSRAVEDDIPFKSLATGIRRMPEGDDALDLTRMVQYCVQNPDEEWMYPRDYQGLCNLLGGPAAVRIEHTDRNVFRRWEEVVPPPPRVWTAEEIAAVTKAMETRPKRQRADGIRRGTPASERQSRDTTPMIETQSKTRKGTRKRVRLEEIDFEERNEVPVAEEEAQQVKQYIRGPARYVAPPGRARSPSASAISLAFVAEHDVGETNPSSAYVFGGPRNRPPYRMLHNIQQPDASDSSGWAENLRWACEQRACFWHAVETEGWNESPAHMELIVQTRRDQNWASDELLELLAESGDEIPQYVTRV